MTHLSPARRCSPSLRSAAQSRVAQTYRPDPVRLGRVALRRNRGRTTMQLGNGTTRAYSYDTNSQRTTLTDPDGGVFTSTFDLDGRQNLVVDPDGKRTTFVFDSLGRPTTITDGSGVVEALSYDGESQLTTQIRDIAGVKTTIVDGYDAVGSRATRNTNGALTTWVYDAADRLTNQQGTSAFATFTMDATGNVTVKNHQGANPVTMTYDLAGRLTTSIQGSAVTTFTCDANGNQTVEESTGVVTHVFDLENRLTLVEDGVRLSTYTFDGDGLRRSVHQVGSVLTTMIWDGTDYLGETTSGTLSARVTNAIGRIIAEKRGGSRRYHQHDALGNTIALINDAGTITNTFVFWPYGELAVPIIGFLPTPFLYCGQWGYYTDSLGRIYVRARVYRPALTRWLTVDPLWPWESAFGYVGGSPLSAIDSFGSLTISVNSFISRDMTPKQRLRMESGGYSAYEWIPVPRNLGFISHVKADERGFFERGTSRIRSSFFVEDCSIGNLGPISLHLATDVSHGARQAFRWESWKHYRHFQDRATLRGSVKIVSQQSTEHYGSTELVLHYTGSDPLIPLAPPIEMMAHITLEIAYCTGAIDVRVRAWHTAFPWHEASVKMSRRSRASYKLFTYSPPIKNFLQLFRFDYSSGAISTKRERCKQCPC